MKNDLQKIANTLILYSYHIENKGLINGKMGIAFFLYHYARYAHDRLYDDFADDLLDEILAAIHQVPFDFENGLTGIGWSINYLIKNRFLDGDPDEALQYVDNKVFLLAQTGNIQNSLFGQGLYLLSRINPANIEQKHIEQAIKMIDYCCEQLNKEKTISLYYLNSVLYFLIQIEKLGICEKQINSIKTLILQQIKKSLHGYNTEDSDLYAFCKILKRLNVKQKKQWKPIAQLKNNLPVTSNGKISVEKFISNSRNTLLYFDNKLKLPSSESITRFINEKQESLTIYDFLLANGLAGLGVGLILNK